MNLQDLGKRAEKFANYMTRIRRAIHTKPELGFSETETAALVRNELSSLEVKVEDLSAGCSRGALSRVGLRGTGRETISLHNAGLDFNDDALATGAALLSGLVLRLHGS